MYDYYVVGVTLITWGDLVQFRKMLQIAKCIVDIKSRSALSYLRLLGHMFRLPSQ